MKLNDIEGEHPPSSMCKTIAETEVKRLLHAVQQNLRGRCTFLCFDGLAGQIIHALGIGMHADLYEVVVIGKVGVTVVTSQVVLFQMFD
jgi:hypothetical protein